MALNIELFDSVINEGLYKQNIFMAGNLGMDHSKFVKYLDGDGSTKGAAVVHVPSASATLPTITKNRSSFPITANSRVDVDMSYNINGYDSGAFSLSQIDASTVAYDKAASLMYNINQALGQVVGNQTAYAWSPTSATTFGTQRIIRTSGATQTAALALPGASGQSRNALTLANIAQAKNMLDQDLMPAEDRYMVIPNSIWSFDILPLANITQYLQLGSVAGLQEGKISEGKNPSFLGRIYGFNIWERQSVSVYAGSSANTDASLALVAINDGGEPSAFTAYDNLAIIFGHRSAVSQAYGQTVMFYQPNNPLYLGDLFSAYIRHGASQLRSTVDGRGVGAIVQR
jgi:hypothetical protein